MKTYEEIGKTIKDLRIGKGLTQAELAKAVNVTASTIMRWEKGNVKHVGSRHLLKMALFLNVSLYEILGV